MSIEITASYLIEKGLLENVEISEFEDGTPFAIFDGWSDVYEVYYAVVETLIPEAIHLYQEAGLITESRWSGNNQITDMRIDGEVPNKVQEALEDGGINCYDVVESALGCEWGFSDAYTTCSDCNGVIRTSPDNYSWQPDFYVGDGYIACNKCFNETEAYQEAYIAERVNNPESAVNGLLTEDQIENLGFIKVDEDFESGWYDRHDNPREIYDELSERYDEVLFLIDGVGQFHVSFVAFVRGGGN